MVYDSTSIEGAQDDILLSVSGKWLPVEQGLAGGKLSLRVVRLIKYSEQEVRIEGTISINQLVSNVWCRGSFKRKGGGYHLHASFKDNEENSYELTSESGNLIQSGWNALQRKARGGKIFKNNDVIGDLEIDLNLELSRKILSEVGFGI